MHRHRSTRSWQVMGEPFDLSTRYKVVDYLGSGAYGMVCAAHDYQSNEMVAIKKCKKIFQSRTLAKRTLREMRLLRHLQHENIVRLKTILPPHDEEFYMDLYLVFEVMDTDLAQIIRSQQPLKEQHTQYFTYQLLRALEFLHSKSIVHRDIKPRNILVNADCTLKLADFGLARLYRSDGPEGVTAITDYVTTRWYRAPEVIVGWSSYTSAIDMWAVGCIVAELLTRSPLFPGENTMKQLGLIIRVMGSPSEGFVLRSTKSMFRQYMLSLMGRRPADLAPLLPAASHDAIDLIRRLLNYDPSQRPSANACLCHPFITRMSSTVSPPVCSPVCIAPEEFDFDLRKLSIDDLRAEIAFEIAYYNSPPVRRARGAEAEQVVPAAGAVVRKDLLEEDGPQQGANDGEGEGYGVECDEPLPGEESSNVVEEVEAVPHQPPPIQEPALKWQGTALDNANQPAGPYATEFEAGRLHRSAEVPVPDLVEVTTPVPHTSAPLTRTSSAKTGGQPLTQAAQTEQERREQEVLEGMAALLQTSSEDTASAPSGQAVRQDPAEVDLETGTASAERSVAHRERTGQLRRRHARSAPSMFASDQDRYRSMKAEEGGDASARAAGYFSCLCEQPEMTSSMEEGRSALKRPPGPVHRASAEVEEEGKVGFGEYEYDQVSKEEVEEGRAPGAEGVRAGDVAAAGRRRAPQPGHRRGGGTGGGGGSRRSWDSALSSCTVQ